MKASVISIDLAKNVFQLCSLNQANKVICNVKIRRTEVLDQLRQFEPTVVAMEACYSAHPWGRAIEALGHEVRLIPPIKVKPFVQGNKNDRNDAVAIAEASLRPNVRFVPVKSLEQQDIQSHQRIRERLIRQRTALINQTRGLLAEYHIVCEKQAYNLRKKLPLIIEDAEQPLTQAARACFHDLYEELRGLDERITKITKSLHNLIKDKSDYQRAQQVPGVGPVIAAATIAAIGDGKQFKNGRQFAAWLGLAPRHNGSGGNCHIGKIGKRGNTQLRMLLVHGARTVMNWCHGKTDRLSLWIQGLLATKPASKVIIAVANKLARILWAVLAKGESYRPA